MFFSDHGCVIASEVCYPKVSSSVAQTSGGISHATLHDQGVGELWCGYPSKLNYCRSGNFRLFRFLQICDFRIFVKNLRLSIPMIVALLK